MPEVRHLTQQQLLTELQQHFGDDPMAWAFKCPSCGDVATGQDMRDEVTKNPHTDAKTGEPMTASRFLGIECLGRLTGALDREGPTNERGCDWAAFGLFRGPWFIEDPEGHQMPAFPIAVPEQ